MDAQVGRMMMMFAMILTLMFAPAKDIMSINALEQPLILIVAIQVMQTMIYATQEQKRTNVKVVMIVMMFALERKKIIALPISLL